MAFLTLSGYSCCWIGSVLLPAVLGACDVVGAAVVVVVVVTVVDCSLSMVTGSVELTGAPIFSSSGPTVVTLVLASAIVDSFNDAEFSTSGASVVARGLVVVILASLPTDEGDADDAIDSLAVLVLLLLPLAVVCSVRSFGQVIIMRDAFGFTVGNWANLASWPGSRAL